MSNTDQQEFWSDRAGPSWIARQSQLDALFQPVLDLVLGSADLTAGMRVLDVGCGTGTSVAQAADRVGASGHVTGIDIAQTMLGHAELAFSNRTNVSFANNDAQTYPFESEQFDALISRFGVMFFSDTTAAFANMARGLGKGARLTMATWGPAPKNPFFMTPAAVAKTMLGPMPQVDRTLPGPFAFEDADRILPMLRDAGLTDATVQSVDLALTPAGDAATLARLCCDIGPAQSALQHHDATAQDRANLEAAIAAQFAANDTAQGLRIPACINLYSARKPA
ncbi:class I SAM-dependent methyltransferase [Tateyamaria sp.]|uniref:class I SAM-dependent methyltransferase n=1 Tax=Tateyamaria sp. TaxID=1929288 RepID=UPI00329BFF33